MMHRQVHGSHHCYYIPAVHPSLHQHTSPSTQHTTLSFNTPPSPSTHHPLLQHTISLNTPSLSTHPLLQHTISLNTPLVTTHCVKGKLSGFIRGSRLKGERERERERERVRERERERERVRERERERERG